MCAYIQDGKDIINALISNSATFQTKTEFSQVRPPQFGLMFSLAGKHDLFSMQCYY